MIILHGKIHHHATARIPVDSLAFSVIEYADTKLSRCDFLVFTKTVRALELRFFSEVDHTAHYLYENTLMDGKDIADNGILVHPLQDKSCKIIKLTRE